MRKTKIICTLGPAIDSDEMLIKMIENGLDCARLNFSHGNYDEHFKRIERVKKLRKKLKKHIPILLDTKGPEIRTGKFILKNLFYFLDRRTITLQWCVSFCCTTL